MIIEFYGHAYRISENGITDPSGEKANFAICVALCKYILVRPREVIQDGTWATYREFRDAGPLIGFFNANTNKTIESSFSGRMDLLENASRAFIKRSTLQCPGRAIVEVAACTRKMLFRYSGLCGMVSDTVDAVRSTIPKGFKLKKYKWVGSIEYRTFFSLKRSTQVSVGYNDSRPKHRVRFFQIVRCRAVLVADLVRHLQGEDIGQGGYDGCL